VAVNGNLTVGDAAGDSVTVNASSFTFANDTNFSLTGGTNGLSFDGTTFSVDAANNRIGIGTATPSDMLHVKDGQIRLSHATANVKLLLVDDVDGDQFDIDYNRGADT